MRCIYQDCRTGLSPVYLNCKNLWFWTCVPFEIFDTRTE